jgi:hypothetical protein
MVERPGSAAPGFDTGGFEPGGLPAVFDGGAAAGDWPNTIVAPPSGAAPAFAAGGFEAGGLLKTMVPLAEGSGPFLGAGGGVRLPVWNIIVRPGASPAGVSAFAGGGFAGAAGWDAGRCCGGGGALATAGAANIAVACMSGAFGGAGATDLAGAGGGWGSGAAAAGRITLNVFWHFPQRMVSPCGPIRASSTR